jgi:Heavy metal binding domain
MRPQTVWAAGLVGLCAIAPSDQPIRAEPIPVQRASESQPSIPPDPSQGVVYICPMDPDVRSHDAGVCRRCGMTLVAGIPDPVEFHLDLRVIPSTPRPGRAAVLQFLVHDPWKNRPVSDFNVVHERFFHAFIVSEDLQFFEHGHPTLVADGVFQYPITFQKAGMFRVLGDYYPAGATPQLTSDTVFVTGGGASSPVQLDRDYSPKTAANVRVSLATVPDRPVATARTQLRFVVDADAGLERYLGAWGHMLAVSNDLIDMMHEHPLLADGGPRLEFEMVFPRPGAYRVWAQFQSAGAVNTVHFDVPVSAAIP